MGLSRVTSQSQKQFSPVSSGLGHYARMASGQVRDAPLLQVSSAQLSRSSSHKTASPRPALDDYTANAGQGLAAEPTLANFVNPAQPDGTKASNGSVQQSGPDDESLDGLLAAVDAAVGAIRLDTVTDGSTATAWDTDADLALVAHDIQDMLGVSASGEAAVQKSGGIAGPDMFFSMPNAAPARTRSNLRTGSMTGSSVSRAAAALVNSMSPDDAQTAPGKAA